MAQNSVLLMVSFFGILVLIGTMIAGVSYLNTAPSPTAIGGAPPEKNQNAQVHHTSRGFEPAIITIHSGQTVEWINDDTIGMWIASDPHPQHTAYEGLDTERSLSPGETFSFLFTKSGVWGYHNDLSPDKTGNIIVL